MVRRLGFAAASALLHYKVTGLLSAVKLSAAVPCKGMDFVRIRRWIPLPLRGRIGLCKRITTRRRTQRTTCTRSQLR